MNDAVRPVCDLLSQSLVERIVAEAIDVLAKVGVYVEDEEAVDLLHGNGARVDKGRVFVPDDLVWRCVRSAPSSISIYNQAGDLAMDLRGRNSHFDPGSAAVLILDSETNTPRPPVTKDLIAFARLTDALPNVDAQSTALVPADVPKAIADRYRLYLALTHCSKPIVTGTFTVEGFAVMRDMLAIVAGGEDKLREKPLAIFDACPSPPLKWSRLTTRSLIDAARAGVPVEMVSMPLFGATAPVTLTGALVQHTAESLAGIAIQQCAGEGMPIIYGGSPAVFDMRRSTTPMGAIETMMVDMAYSQIGRYLEVPTHAYMGLSDSKLIDGQAGAESGVGLVLAALAGINVISGAGMLDFESCQSLTKLVLDDEFVGMAKRLVAGITPRTERMGDDLYGDIASGDHFLTSPTTLEWFREEIFFPTDVIDRRNRDAWAKEDGKDAAGRARLRAADLLATHSRAPLPEDVRNALTELITADARRHGVEALPSALP